MTRFLRALLAILVGLLAGGVIAAACTVIGVGL